MAGASTLLVQRSIVNSCCWNKTHDRASSMMSSSSPSSVGVSRSPDPAWLEKITTMSFPSHQITYVKHLKGQHSHAVYLLGICDGTELVLKVSLSDAVSLVHHERRSLETETKVLSLLSSRKIPWVPRLVKTNNGSPDGIRNGSYLLRHYLRGIPLAEFDFSTLAPEDRQRIDRQLASTVKKIGEQTSTRFGRADAVLSGGGETTWKRAFTQLLEVLLFEAESKLITLPHTEIQRQVMRLMHVLDDVTEPRLVITDLGKPCHIVVDPSTKRITGFTDFSDAIWGDMLFCDVFDNPSASFIERYGSDPTQGESARIRLLLYSCYRCISRIVGQYYQNRNDEVEMAARRKLIDKLNAMANTPC